MKHWYNRFILLSSYAICNLIFYVQKKSLIFLYQTDQNFFGVLVVAYFTSFLFVDIKICVYLKSCGIYSSCWFLFIYQYPVPQKWGALHSITAKGIPLINKTISGLALCSLSKLSIWNSSVTWNTLLEKSFQSI